MSSDQALLFKQRLCFSNFFFCIFVFFEADAEVVRVDCISKGLQCSAVQCRPLLVFDARYFSYGGVLDCGEFVGRRS